MKLLLITNFFHRKNEEALRNYKNINITDINISDLNNLNLEEYDCVYSPSYSINVSQYPNMKFIFGPHFAVFPNERESYIHKISHKNSVYIQPSKWTLDVWKNNFPVCNNLNMDYVPFAVNTNRFKNDLNIDERTNIFIYIKSRSRDDIDFIETYLRNNNINFSVFRYGNYIEKNYLSFLKGAKYGICIDAHESQGFGIQEALSCDVPLLVWNVTSMRQECGTNRPDFYASSVPYWDERCGELFEKREDFEKTFQLFLSKINTYKPREFILENLSSEVCEKRFMDIINNIKL